MSSTTLTIGMATHRDFDGVYFTVNALRLYHADVLPRCEIVIVDNDPDGPQAEHLRGFCAHVAARRSGWPQPFDVRLISYREANGTAAPRDHIFRVARGDAVLILDSHVILWPASLAKLLDWYDAHPDSADLFQGPLVYDDLASVSTHFADVWRDGMWGTWDIDPRGLDPAAPPFEIPSQGLGLFTCRTSAWLGFNSDFREFGGEEWYIHEKFRQAGRKCWYLPFLRWVHRFSAPAAGRAYRLTAMGKIRNYILGLQELGLSLDRLRRHFVDGLNEDLNDPVNRDAHLTAEQFDALVRNSIRYPIQLAGETEPFQADRSAGSNGHSHSNDPAVSLETLYRRAVETPSDINEHCATLRELASHCDTVVEFGMRPAVSTVALLAGQPKRFLTVAAHHDPILDHLPTHAGATAFEFHRGTSLDTEIPDCDLLFLDTKHTADHLTKELARHAPRVRRWMAFHDTDIYGERGEDGGPGLLPALRSFLEQEPAWRVVHQTRANHGLTVISCTADAAALDPRPTHGPPTNSELDAECSPTRRTLLELKGRHDGADLYVIGSAASMDYLDPEFFRDRTVIGCNLVFRRFPVTYSVFKEIDESQLREAAAQSTVIMSRHSYGNIDYPPQRFPASCPRHYVFPHRSNGHTVVDWSVLGTDEIVVSYSTITSAIHVAAYLGAKNIFLCGVDGGRLDGRLNYTGYYSEEQLSEQAQWYREWVQQMLPQTLELRDRLKVVYGCRVYLLSPFLNFQLEGHRFET